MRRVFTWSQQHANGSTSEHTRELEVAHVCSRCGSTYWVVLSDDFRSHTVGGCSFCSYVYARMTGQPTQGGRHVYSDTMLPPPPEDAYETEYARVLARDDVPLSLLERLRSLCWRLDAALKGAAKGWRG